jgi:micrococcal nuclease
MSRSRAALVAIVVAASLVGWWLAGARSGGPGQETVEATVTAAFDGDTIQVSWEERRETVRLLGVDTPETVHPERPVECYGPEASAYTKQRLLGRDVTLTFDRERRDRYGRLLAYVAVDGSVVNDELLTRGLARLLIVPPNGARGRSMLDLELEARSAGRGLWGEC